MRQPLTSRQLQQSSFVEVLVGGNVVLGLHFICVAAIGQIVFRTVSATRF